MSHVTIALKTLHAIDEMVYRDGGAKYRGLLGKVLPHIGDAYRTEEKSFRGHLGASLLGGDCARSIWYDFRWTTVGQFPGRILRLFNRGHIEEGRFIALLLGIGCTIYQQDENGKQFTISFADGHGGGSGDGVAMELPDLHPQTAALCEFKTHGEKSFIELAGPLKEWREYLEDPVHNKFPGKGLREAKFEHYVQMQLYMYKMGLACGLYMAVNKNTDDLYAEIIQLDPELAQRFVERGEKIVYSNAPPDKINKSPGFFKCRFCSHRGPCQLKVAPQRNCRTCQFSEPQKDGTWHCYKHATTLTKEAQFAGCDQYEKSRVFDE